MLKENTTTTTGTIATSNESQQQQQNSINQPFLNLIQVNNQPQHQQTLPSIGSLVNNFTTQPPTTTGGSDGSDRAAISQL